MNSLFLFGAGASYGSDQVGVPPLGATLFDALRNFNPAGWGQLPVDLADEFKTDFERGMSRLAESNSHAMPVLQRAMAAFFFNFVPRTSSVYVELARRIRKHAWTGALGTLNYERLLELSLAHVGVQPVVGEPSGRDKVEMCLPHGCCHIFCEGVRMAPVGVSFSGVGVTIDGPVSVIGDPTQFAQRIRGDAVPPVMSYFEPNKATSAGASFIEGQRQRWTELVATADAIAIVGVRVRPHDDHIWGPIANNTNASVLYAAGPNAGKEFAAWSAEARPAAENVVAEGYFLDEIDAVCSHVGLT